MTSLKYSSKIIPLLKFILVAGLLYFLIHKGFISVSAISQALAQWEKIAPAIFLLLLTTPLGALRWQWLLQAQNIQIPWLKTLQLTLIGNFFNIALPGAVSGDFVKAYYVAKLVHGEKSPALGSILFDRVAGVSALVLVSSGAMMIGLRTYYQSSLFQAIQFLMMTAACIVLVFYTYLFLVKERQDPLLRLLKKLEKKLSYISALTRVYRSMRHYHHHRLTVIKVLGASIAIHLSVGWSCLIFAQTLGATSLPLLSLYVIVPLGLLVTAIPIAPGGIGTGNVAFLYLFQLLGCDRGADIYSLFALQQILFSCLGGLVYFQFRPKQL